VQLHAVRPTADLIPLAAAGDREARAVLVRTHGPSVWGLCRRLCPEPEDAYQEVWEKVLGALARFDPSGPATLRTWILAVTHRHLVDLHRRRRVRGDVVALPELAVVTDVDEPIDRQRRVQRVETALSCLPEGHRRVILLHHLHGLPLDQIAEAEGVALGTVKSRLHRGRARLAELLEER
jgi:RNA polymerase sigma-70 factor (ECF subfamily)